MSIVDRIAREAPLPLVALGALFAMILARELGAAAHRWLRKSADAPERGSNDEAHILTAVLGLLALLVAFTFSLALDRHETRRALVVTEANALGSAYLRTAMLDDPEALRADLRAYARERLAYGLASGREQEAAGERANRLQVPVWRDALAATKAFHTTPLSGLVLAPINEAFDAATQRKAALAAHLPATVLTALALYAVIAAACWAIRWPAPAGGIGSPPS